MTKQQQLKAEKLTILARYAHKTNGQFNGNVSYLVRNGGGKEYCVTIAANGNTSCVLHDAEKKLYIPESCPSSKGSRKCYHVKGVEQVERERAARKESLALLAKIEQETLAQIEEELAVVPAIGKSEQARLAELPLSEDELRDVEQFHAWQEELDDEKRYSRWSKQECEAADRAAYVAMFDPCGLAS